MTYLCGFSAFYEKLRKGQKYIRNAQVACSSHVSSSIKSRLFFQAAFYFCLKWENYCV